MVIPSSIESQRKYRYLIFELLNVFEVLMTILREDLIEIRA